MRTQIKFTIDDPLPSWNKLYSQAHWSKRKELVDDWHGRVSYYMMAQKIPRMLYEVPIDIKITCYYKDKRSIVDPDNVCDKLLIDALKDWVIKDDTYEYIKRVTTEARLDRENPRTEVILTPYED